MFIVRRLLTLDFILALSVVVLCSLSLIMLFSMFSTSNQLELFHRQAFFAILAIILMIAVGLIDYDHLKTYSRFFFLITVCVLAFVLFFGATVNGTAGWINLGFTSVQPVEFAKVILIIYLAHFISQKRSELGEIATIVGSFMITAVLAGFILYQPDTGSAMVMIAIWLGMIIASGIKKRYIGGFLLLACVVMIFSWNILAQYQKDRITTFLNPQSDPRDAGYNVIQSLVAVGNGGVAGRGVGSGTQSGLNFLPEKHTDFIFASYVEALGFVGAAFLLLLFTIIFVRMRRIALFAKDAFGYFLVVGVTVLLFVHVTVNVGMNMGVVPVTGIPLPFVSYGGSALISMSAAVGIALSVYRYRQKIRAQDISESY